MEIVVVNEYSDQLLNTINELLPELSSSATPVSEIGMKEIIDNPTANLLLAQESGEYYGTLTLLLFPNITRYRAWIEDVVVLDSARGKGVGKMLTHAAVKLAQELGTKMVDLTSRPSREVANNLYQSAEFLQRETNVYRYSF